MDNFWNSKDLKPPTINSFKCKSPAIDLNTILSILNNGIDTFSIPNTLRVESALMRRMLYRLNFQYRQDKGFKLLGSTNRYLNNLFSFNITEDLTYLLDEIPKTYEKDMYLPCKQMLEYVLVRLQGYSQVCGRVVESAFRTASFVKCQFPLGVRIVIWIPIFAISCRIWQICRYLTTKCCLLFNDLLPLLDKLKITGTKWLPDGYEFPKDLINWLNYEWLLEMPDIMLQLPLELPIFSLLDDDDDDDIQYAGEYKLHKNKRDSTVISLDSDIEDEFTNVQFLYNSRNKPAKIASKSVINVDSDSDVEFNNIDNFNLIDSEDDGEVLIVEPNENTTKTTTDSLNISGITSLNTNDEIIEISSPVEKGTNQTTQPHKLPNNIPSYINSVNSQSNEKHSTNDAETKSVDIENINDSDDDLGEPITQKNISKKDMYTFSDEGSRYNINESKINSDKVQTPKINSVDIEKINESDDDLEKPITQKDISRNDTYSDEESRDNVNEMKINSDRVQTPEIESDKENKNYKIDDSDDDDVGEPITRDGNNQNNKSLKGNKIFGNCIYANGKIYNIETFEEIESLLHQENSLREEGLLDDCLFSYIDNDDWIYLSYQIKFLIALVDNESKRRRENVYLKLKTMLTDILDVDADDTCDSDNLIILPKCKKKNKALLAKQGKLLLIKSIKTAKHLQIFLETENKFRETLRSKSMFKKLRYDVWIKLYNQIKCTIVLANRKPIRSTVCVKQARIKLMKLIQNNGSNNNTQEFKQIPVEKLDKLYNNNNLGTNWNELSDYFRALLCYEDPTKMSTNMKRMLIKRTKNSLNITKTNHAETLKIHSQINPLNQFNEETSSKLNKNKTNKLKKKHVTQENRLLKVKNNSVIATSSKNTKMNKLSHCVSEQDNIVPEKPKRVRKKQNMAKTSTKTILNKSNQQTPRKLSKGQKRKLQLEEVQRSKKLRFGH